MFFYRLHNCKRRRTVAKKRKNTLHHRTAVKYKVCDKINLSLTVAFKYTASAQIYYQNTPGHHHSELEPDLYNLFTVVLRVALLAATSSANSTENQPARTVRTCPILPLVSGLIPGSAI